MVGGGSRKDGPVAINSTNVFAALGSLKKKKKSDKGDSSSKNAGSSKTKHDGEGNGVEEQVFWAPAPLTMKSWADVDDEDDDDYYATTAPPPSVWVAGEDDQKGNETPVEVRVRLIITPFSTSILYILI